MTTFIEKIIGAKNGKKDWRAMEARAKALPHDYRVVYDEIKQYIWKTGGIDGMDIFRGLLDLFEEGVANGQPVLAITGENVAGFCDELLRDSKTYVDGWRNKLNKTVAKKLAK